MKTDKIDFAINNIDDDHVNLAIETDDREKLISAVTEERKKKITRYIKLYCSAAAALCIVITAVFIINRPEMNDGNLVQAVSPITEISSVDMFTDYLGYTLPVIDGKEVSVCLVYSSDKKPYMGEIRYSDLSSFRMSKTDEDISGIYGGHGEGEFTRNGVNVSLFSMGNIKYGTWQNNGYSYCYSTENSDEEITDIIRNTIK